MKNCIWIILFAMIPWVRVFPQDQFQIKYGLNNYIQEIAAVKQSHSATYSLLALADCFNSQNIPSCNYLSVLKFDSLASPSVSYKFYASIPDTSIIPNDFCINQNGDLLICGIVYFGGDYKSILIKIDSSLSFISATVFPYGGTNFFNKIVLADDQSVYVLGFIDSLFIGDQTQSNIICKFDQSLNLRWSKIISPGQQSFFNDMTMLGNGNILLGGYKKDTATITNALSVIIDTGGTVLESNLYKCGNMVSCYKVVSDSSSYYLFGGLYDSIFSMAGLYILQHDLAGNILNEHHYFFIYSYPPSISIQNGNLFLSALYYNAGSGTACIIKTDSIGNIQWSNYYPLFEENVFFTSNNSNNINSFGKSWDQGKMFFYSMKADSLGITGCSENAFSPGQSNNLYLNKMADSLELQDYNPINFSISMHRDTFPIQREIVCSTYTFLEDIDENRMSIYPNPSSSYITIRNLEQYTDINKFEITDVLGNLVLSGLISSTEEFNRIDISVLKSGLYFVNLKGGSRQYMCKMNKM